MSSRNQDEEVRQDLARLEAMLQRVVGADASFQEKLVAKEDLQILDLACGACDEAETLTRFFSTLREPGRGKGKPRRPRKKRKSLKLTGLDIRDREIAQAAERFKKQRDPGDDSEVDYEFLHGDATKIDRHHQLPGQFDVIFMRHQNLWNGKRTWEEIFHKALEKLSPEGRLIITSYFDREHEQALATFQEQGGELIVTAENEASRQLITPGKSVDRHVAIFRRKE